MGRLSQLDGTRVVRAFVRLGWRVDRIHGSHHVLVRDGEVTLSVPVHQGRPVKQGTMRGLLRLARIGEDEFLAAY